MSVISRIGTQHPRSELWQPEEAYNRAARSYDGWYWQKIWQIAESDLVERAVAKQDYPARILDIGCGTGTLLGKISNASPAEAELVGIDISRGMLDRAREKFGHTSIKFVQGDFLDSKFQNRSFDVLFMFRVASHIEDLRLCLLKVAALIKKGGTFAFSDVDSEYPYECTRLPIPEGRIPVVTHKHTAPTIIKVASECSLSLKSVRTCSVRELPGNLKQDPELPRSLMDQLESGLDVPFGCQMQFSLAE